MRSPLPGYYVEGRYYANRYAQAVCRARFLASEYGRAVDVRLTDHQGRQELAVSVAPASGVQMVAA